MASRPRGRPIGRTLLVVGMVGAGACALGDILAPGPGTLVVSSLTSLAIFPVDTVLADPGDGFCYRAEARDSTGALVPDVTPEYAVTDGTSLVDVTADGCVVALARGGAAAHVVGRLGTLSANATVWVPAPGTNLVATLEIAPADTTLTTIGSRACYRWVARDASGADLPDVEPVFSLRANPGQHVSGGPEPNCFNVESLGIVNAIVDARAGTATASAMLRIRP